MSILGIKSENTKAGKLKLVQPEVDFLVKKLVNYCSTLRTTHEIQFIVAINRGGLVPGVYLSHALNVSLITLTWQTRDIQHIKRDTKTLTNILETLPIENTLFIDDICDSGTTIEQIRQFIPNSRWAVLVSKKDDMNLEWVGDSFKGEEWVVFPWEEFN